MRAKTIKESLNEFGGAGYAVYGGSVGYGNSGRGGGFGGSANKGGPNLMYTYDVKDLNQSLQPKPTPQDNEKYTHVGCEAKAKSLQTGKWIEGKIISAKTDSDGNILHYEMLNPKTGKNENVDPSSVELIEHDLQPEMSMRDVVGESFYPRINFERGQDPKKSMDLGLNKKILAEKIVKILNNVYFSWQPGTPTVTWSKSKKSFKDTDGNTVSIPGMIKWAKEILSDEENFSEIDLPEEERNRLINDIRTGRISGEYPMDDDIGIYYYDE